MRRISMIRGTSQNIDIVLTDTEGNPYLLTGNELLRFGVKKHPNNNAHLLIKEITKNDSVEEGTYTLNLVPSDTENMDLGILFYDVGLQSGEDYYNVIECSEFQLRPNITAYVRQEDE